MHFGLISPLWHTCARQQGAAAAARLEPRRASLTDGDLQHRGGWCAHSGRKISLQYPFVWQFICFGGSIL